MGQSEAESWEWITGWWRNLPDAIVDARAVVLELVHRKSILGGWETHWRMGWSWCMRMNWFLDTASGLELVHRNGPPGRPRNELVHMHRVEVVCEDHWDDCYWPLAHWVTAMLEKKSTPRQEGHVLSLEIVLWHNSSDLYWHSLYCTIWQKRSVY